MTCIVSIVSIVHTSQPWTASLERISHERVSVGDCDFPDRLKINDNLFLPIGPGGPGGLADWVLWWCLVVLVVLVVARCIHSRY